MLRYQNLQTTVELTTLMDLAGTLRELTAEPRTLGQIPQFLATALGLQRVTLALVRQVAGQEGQIVMMSSSEATADGMTGEGTSLQRAILELSQKGAAGEAAGAQGLGGEPYSSGHQMVVGRQVDGTHRMLLLVGYEGAGAVGAATQEMVQLLSTFLAKSLGTMLRWQEDPQDLGEPFDRLTEREWVVLCGLNSEDGEKQLADRLGLSPHTLHSHIKAIYRKVGVQGRLPLLQQFHRALREYRVRAFTPSKVVDTGRVAG